MQIKSCMRIFVPVLHKEYNVDAKQLLVFLQHDLGLVDEELGFLIRVSSTFFLSCFCFQEEATPENNFPDFRCEQRNANPSREQHSLPNRYFRNQEKIMKAAIKQPTAYPCWRKPLEIPRALTGRFSRAIASARPQMPLTPIPNRVSVWLQRAESKKSRKYLNKTGAESKDCKNDEVEDQRAIFCQNGRIECRI